jgi:uncharacterized protein
MADDLIDELCTACGLCCNGVLFTDTRCTDDDEAARVENFGIQLLPGEEAPRFRQPCSQLSSTRCLIYQDRPLQCQTFECELLRRTRSEERDIAGARRIVEQTQVRVGEIRTLLARLGDTDDSRPLAHRFESVREQATDKTEDWWDDYARLTLAVGVLQKVLKSEFYRISAD